MPTDLKASIRSALQAIPSGDFRSTSLALLQTLGYSSDKTVALDGSKPKAFRQLIRDNNPETNFNEKKALFAEWTSADLLFQFTDEEIARELTLFTDTELKPSLLKSYLFFAIELSGGDYARGKLTAIARQINRVFPMPVMVLIKHLTDKQPVLSIAVINRRQSKRDTHKDVLGKVTIIRDISLSQPHRGHLDILDSFAFENLKHPQKLPIRDFDTLHTAWEEIFNVELLNKRFYKELANWYFWALPQVDFPTDLEPDDEKRRATGLIRLLTRLIFCWFLKEKGLVPEQLFHPADLEKILNGFDPESETSSTYYQAILQNLFFATLNQRMGKDGKGNPYRAFAKDEGFQKNRNTHDVNNLYRYEALFQGDSEDALEYFADIPFLNGGLFECLDKRDEDQGKTYYLDGFSRNPKKRPHVPDRLFFDSGETTDLSAAYGDKKRKSESVTGLINILNRYKFTIVENTPIDQEIALDPELLGKVFENLLASYNEETKTTARKQTGSFYTPRPIVDYMVDESLKAHLTRALVEKARIKEPEARSGLDDLFSYTENQHAFIKSPVGIATLITAIDEVKVLDPACGSGAFPMGVLHKLVYILGKLDPDNERWKQTQLAKLDSAPMREQLEAAFEDNNDDYGRKLYLIENCLYGVDIQPIAIQITKLRFFISLVCDQKTNRNKKDNHGIRPLPNLETKFVAANTLIGLPEMTQSLLVDPRIGVIEKEIESLYHSHFSEQNRSRKLANQRKIKTLRQELAKLLAESLMSPAKSKHVAEWNPFDPQSSADFFDPHWMFGRSLTYGFDIVIGNPPYVNIEKIPISDREKYLKIYGENGKLGKRYDLYQLFIMRGILDLRKNGLLTLILPNTFLMGSSYLLLRRKICQKTSIIQVTDLPQGVFENAIVDNVLILLQLEHKQDNSILINKLNTRSSLDKIAIQDWDDSFMVRQSEINSDNAFKINVHTNHELKALFNKLVGQSVSLGNITKSSQGIIIYKTKHDSLLNEHTSGSHKTGWKKLLRGTNIGLYCIKWKGEYLHYGDWLWCARDVSFFDEPKILLQAMRNKSLKRRLVGAYDNQKHYNAHNLANIIAKKDSGYPLKYILGVFNSSLINFWYRCHFPNVNINPGDFRQIPICQASDDKQQPIIQLVEQITEVKGSNPNADTSMIELEIDQLIYKLYDLTPKEIGIVESSVT